MENNNSCGVKQRTDEFEGKKTELSQLFLHGRSSTSSSFVSHLQLSTSQNEKLEFFLRAKQRKIMDALN